MGHDKKASLELPTYTRPTEQMVAMPGYGTTYYRDNTWGFNVDPTLQAEQNQLDALKKSILSSLGITAPEREASLNQWQDTFQKEALRTMQPQLEQSLFARGLGGSKYYSNALTDLLSKVLTESILNRESLVNQDEQLKLQQLGQVSGMYNTNYGNIYNLIAAAMAQSSNAERQAWQEYMDTLPYKAVYHPYEPAQWKIGLSKMMSIADPAGSYMGNYGPYAQQMSGMGKAMEMYGAFKGQGGGSSSGPTYAGSGGNQPFLAWNNGRGAGSMNWGSGISQPQMTSSGYSGMYGGF